MKTTAKQRAYFEERLIYWGKKVCPSIRPRLQKENTDSGNLAEVLTSMAFGACGITLDHDAGERPLSEFNETALHEMLHAMLAPMTEHLETIYNREYVLQLEHAIIHPLIHALIEADNSKLT